MANYLYNGMEFPALPEWDKGAYPYAFVWYDQGFIYTKAHLYLLSEIVYQTKDDGSYCLVTRELHAVSTLTSSGWSDWTDFEEYPYGSSTLVTSLFTVGFNNEKQWANFDILSEDGTVSLAASYPIDAETGEEIHDYEIGGEPEQPETDLTNIDLYRKINGQLVKHTLYKKVGGELVKVDEYST
jgi:hypothetical protein